MITRNIFARLGTVALVVVAVGEAVADNHLPLLSTLEQPIITMAEVDEKSISDFIDGTSIMLNSLAGHQSDDLLNSKITVLFVAKEDAIENGRVSSNALPSKMGQAEKEYLLSFETESDQCFIAKFHIEDQDSEREVLMVVSNTSKGTNYEIRRCFLFSMLEYWRIDTAGLMGLSNGDVTALVFEELESRP